MDSGGTLALFGRKVRTLRHSRGLSQDELAHVAQMDRVFLGQLERGQRSASLDSLEKLAHALEVDLKDLLDFTRASPAPERSPSTQLGRRVAVLAHGAPLAELERFEQIAKAFFANHRPRRKRR